MSSVLIVVSSAQNTTLGIPALFQTEGLHGFIDNGTIFPSPIAMACSFNPSLMEKSAARFSLESGALGVNSKFFRGQTEYQRNFLLIFSPPIADYSSVRACVSSSERLEGGRASNVAYRFLLPFPCCSLDLGLEPRFGRVEEGFGEGECISSSRLQGDD